MTGPESLQSLRDALIEVLNNNTLDPVPATGHANSRQLMNALVQTALTAPTSAIPQILEILAIPDAPPES